MSIRQIVPSVVAHFRQELTDLAKSAQGDELDPRSFAKFVDGLKAVLASAGREAFGKYVSLQDEAEDLFELDDLEYRFKQTSTKEWLTPFGVVQVASDGTSSVTPAATASRRSTCVAAWAAGS